MNSYLYEVIIPAFDEHGLDVESIESYPANARDTTQVHYRCKCGVMISKSVRTLKEKPYCKPCTPVKLRATTQISKDKFIALLKSEGYELLEPEKFINTKSLVDVRSPNGEIYETSQNRFAGGHRSRAEAVEKQKVPLEEVKRRVVEANFIWLEDTIYEDGHKPMKLQCHCGKIANVCLHNIRENRVGCDDCYRFNRTYPWEYIEGIAEKFGCTIITSGDQYRGRDTIIEVFCYCGEEMMKNVRCFLKAPRCIMCSCELREETNIERYGSKNLFSSEYGKEKIANYHKTKSSEQREETTRRAKETCLKNNGYECALALPAVRQSATKAHILKWGDRPGCVKEIREKMEATNMERRGVKYPLESKEVQETIKKKILQKYGVTNIMQVPEIFEKAQASAFKLKLYTFPSGKEVKIQGYENKCLDYLLFTLNINENDIITGAKNMPKVMYKDEIKERRYFMDAYIKSKDKGIEVKSIWTYCKYTELAKNKAKWITASYICKGGIDVYIFDKKEGLLLRRSIKQGEIVKEKICKFPLSFKHEIGEFL